VKKSLFPQIGKTVYPTPDADRNGSRVGRTPFRRCIQCGLPNDTRKTAWAAAGEGLGEPYTVASSPNTKDRDVKAGCRFCGSLHWQHSKPTPLPDGRNYPADENRRYRKRR